MLMTNALKVINFQMFLQKQQKKNYVETKQWRGLINIYVCFHVSNKLVIA